MHPHRRHPGAKSQFACDPPRDHHPKPRHTKAMTQTDAEQEHQPARRPTLEDIPEVLEAVAQGSSLRQICREMGLHTPSTHTMLDTDRGLREQYARAREQRAEIYAEKALKLGLQAAEGKKKADGVRVALDAIKWATARMAPKTAPKEHVVHSFESLSDEELDARLAAAEERNASNP